MKRVFYSLIAVFIGSASLAQQDDVLAASTDSTGKITVIQNNEITRISDYQIKRNVLSGGKTSGYRIEIFFGNDRKEAQKIIKKFKEERDSIACDLQFDNPYLRVRVGNFRSRLEAQKLYFDLKDEFETVIIVKVPRMDFPPIE